MLFIVGLDFFDCSFKMSLGPPPPPGSDSDKQDHSADHQHPYPDQPHVGPVAGRHSVGPMVLLNAAQGAGGAGSGPRP